MENVTRRVQAILPSKTILLACTFTVHDRKSSSDMILAASVAPNNITMATSPHPRPTLVLIFRPYAAQGWPTIRKPVPSTAASRSIHIQTALNHDQVEPRRVYTSLPLLVIAPAPGGSSAIFHHFSGDIYRRASAGDRSRSTIGMRPRNHSTRSGSPASPAEFPATITSAQGGCITRQQGRRHPKSIRKERCQRRPAL